VTRPDRETAYQLGLQMQEQVLSHAPEAWRPAVMAYIRSLPAGTICTGESIRIECIGRGLTPHHPNAWGAAIRVAVKDGLLQETGRFLHMRARSSHGRRNPEYIRL
jgi:hypothetical protein